MELNDITRQIIGAAIEVHKELCPGLLESAYETCLCYELTQRGLSFQRQVPVPIIYKEVKLNHGYRMDILVESRVVVELKVVEFLSPVHEAQILTYMRLAHKPLGLILNFHVKLMTDGIKRYRI